MENSQFGIKWNQPLLAPPMPFTAKDFPTLTTRTNTIAVKLLPSDPQSLLGKDVLSVDSLVNTPAPGILSSTLSPIAFATTTGDISNISLDLYSPALPKQITIN